VMVGNGKMETELKALSEAHSNIHFLPFQNQQNMPAIYQLADVFVLPSKGPGETWGLAINEAMAAGKPVLVSSKCGGSADLIVNGENGYLFTAGSKAALKDCIKLFVDNKSKLEQMGQRSLQKIQSFSFEKIAEAMENAVMDLKDFKNKKG
jgi:glycosyltransferase involved in cell wall biosynthesis